MTGETLHCMNSSNINGLKLFFFENLSSCNCLFHGISTRVGGVSTYPFKSLNIGLNTDDTYENVMSNHLALSNALEFDLNSLVSSVQIHSSRIKTVNSIPEESKTGSVIKYTFDGYDALITACPDVTIVIRVADCVPIILFDPVTTVMAVIHAGWKGTAEGITSKTIDVLINQYSCLAGNIKAGIGPSIGPCCFRVRENVADRFRSQTCKSESLIIIKKSGFSVNLQEANKVQMTMRGVRADNIEVSHICTSCNSHLFFSHRRESGKTGRFGLFAGLRA